MTNAEKKAVKSNLAKIDDYFDFSFRPQTNAEENVATKIEEVANDSKVGCGIIEEAKTCEAYTLSDEARRIVSVAREGSLFG